VSVHVLDVPNAMHDRAEDDGPEHHLEQRNEALAQWPHFHGLVRREQAGCNGQRDCNQNLDVQLAQQPHCLLRCDYSYGIMEGEADIQALRNAK
jgi:hypothetical protein